MKRSTPPPPPLTVTAKKTKPRYQRLGGFDLQQVSNGGFRLRLDTMTTLEQAMAILALLKSDAGLDD